MQVKVCASKRTRVTEQEQSATDRLTDRAITIEGGVEGGADVMSLVT